ncbi:putative death-receptor fusion protein-domain-containing protein [Melampsora americana]|nr:putative death-receptor fusion protein-domain-containing protein [Melampsora americana]
MKSSDSRLSRLETMKEHLMQSARQRNLKDARQRKLPMKQSKQVDSEPGMNVVCQPANHSGDQHKGSGLSQLEATCSEDVPKQAAFDLALGVLLGTYHWRSSTHLDLLTESTQWADPTDVSQEAIASLDIINLLLRECKLETKEKRDSPSQDHTGLSVEIEVAISKAIWKYWNSSLGIAHKIKATLTNLLEYSATLSSTSLDRPAIRTFLDLIKDAVFVEKRTFAILLYLLSYMSVEEIVQELRCHVSNCDEFLSIVLHAIGDDKIASVAGQLAVRWTFMTIGCDRDDSNKEVEPQASNTQHVWIQMSCSILLCEDERKRQYLCRYYLRNLFKQDPIYFTQLRHELMKKVKSGREKFPISASLHELSGVIALACVGRSVGGLDRDQDKLCTGKQYGQIDEPTLLVCLSHSSTSLRSSALSVICQSNSFAAPLPTRHLALLEKFFCWSLGEIDAELKQNIKSNLKTLLERLRDSSHAANKRIQDFKTKEKKISSFPHDPATLPADDTIRTQMTMHATYLTEVQSFLNKLKTLWISNCTPFSPYRNQISCLNYLKLLLDTGIDSSFQSPTNSGSYEPSKDLSGSMDVPKLPKAGQISRFPFELCIMDSSLVRVLVAALNSTYDDIRNLAFLILQSAPTPLPGYEANGSFEHEIVDVAIKLSGSNKASETCTGNLLLRLIVDKAILSGSRRVPSALLPRSDNWPKSENPLALFLYGRLEALEDCIEAAEIHVADACESRPVQGFLMTISSLLACLSEPMMQSLVDSNDLFSILEKARELVQRVWDFAKVVLCAAAPDSNYMEDQTMTELIPDHEDARAEVLIAGDNAAGDSADKHVDLTADFTGPRRRAVLSACWRGMKEASALLTEVARVMTLHLSCSYPSGPGVISLDVISDIGRLFETWLLEIRHRGAFGAIHASYSKLCGVLCSLPHAGTSQPPAVWLKMHINAITSRKLSFTRRSAGLPFCILSTCQALSSCDLGGLQEAFGMILKISQDVDTPLESKIHCLNTLKILHTDALISSKVVSLFVEQSYHLAIQSFVSPDWRIRNGALILFSGLTTRVFGSRALDMDRTYHMLCKRETITDFFHRLPLLNSILLKELRRSIENDLHISLQADLQSPLFAVLSLLSLLQNPNESLAANDYIPLVQRCLESRVSKIRAISADAMTGLVSSLAVPTRLCDLLGEAIVASNFNQMHGKLLAVNRLIEVSGSLSVDDKIRVSAALHHLAMFFSSNKSIPYLCQLVFLQILDATQSRFGIEIELQVYESMLLPRLFVPYDPSTPAINSFLRHTVKHLLNRGKHASLLSECLVKGSSVIQISALEFILTLEDSRHRILPNTLNDVSVKQAIISLCRNETISVNLRLPALQVLAQGIIQITPSDWTVPEIIDDYEKARILPIQDVILIIMAHGIVKQSRSDDETIDLNAWQETFFDKVKIASLEDQSIGTRHSAAKALSAVSDIYNTLASPISMRFLDAAIFLLQDDDEDVRSTVVECIGGMANLSDGSPKVPRATLEVLLQKATEIDPNYLIEKILNPGSFQSDVDHPLGSVCAIFSKERLNLYRDDLAEVYIMHDLQRAQDSSIRQGPSLPLPTSISERFQQAVSILRTLIAADDGVHQQADSTSWSLPTHSRLLGLHILLTAKTLETQFQYQFEAHEHAFLENIKAQLNFTEVYNV